MTARVYNASLVVALAMIGAGIALVSLPAALVTVGTLILALTIFGAVAMRSRRR